MIDKPTHVEQSQPLVVRGTEVTIFSEGQRMAPYETRNCRSDLVHRHPGVHCQRGYRNGSWMREVGYTGVFWTLLSVRWELLLRGFRCRVSVPLDQSSPCSENRRHFRCG